MPFPARPRTIAKIFAILALAAAAAIAAIRSDGNSLSRARDDGYIRIGYAVEAPYAFVADGAVTGVSPETARLVAARLRLRIEWVLTDFGSLIGDLNAGRFDVIAAGLFVTRERASRSPNPNCACATGCWSRRAIS